MEYGFAQDSDFTFISTKPAFWKGVIDKYYQKYQGIGEWHQKLLTQVGKHGKLVSPFGRRFEWDLMKYGEYKIPTTQVKNYMVQGTGADVVAIARVSLFKRLKQRGVDCKLICTVHDSIVIDCREEMVYNVVQVVNEVFSELPDNINKLFDVGWDLDVNVEIQTGMDLYNLKEI